MAAGLFPQTNIASSHRSSHSSICGTEGMPSFFFKPTAFTTKIKMTVQAIAHAKHVHSEHYIAYLNHPFNAQETM